MDTIESDGVHRRRHRLRSAAITQPILPEPFKAPLNQPAKILKMTKVE